MHNVHDNILECVGSTPLVRLNSVTKGLKATVYAKVEMLNPGASVKDRIAMQIIEDAEASGELKPGGCIVEATSGNTGAGLAMAAAIKGYKCIFILPDKQSEEKRAALRAYGAKVVVTPTNVAPEDPTSYYSVSRRIADETPNAFYANQYHNPSNPKAHVRFTGPELYDQIDGKIDAFIAGIGTGGTITGVGQYLKSKKPDTQIVGVDPVGSLYYDLFKTGKMTEATSYVLEGIGEDFLPSTMDFSCVDDMIRVHDTECFQMTRRLAQEEGLFVGGSCGAAVAGALKWVRRNDREGMVVVVLLPDSGSRYMSKIYNDEWMRDQGFLAPSPELGTVADLRALLGPGALDRIDADTTASQALEAMSSRKLEVAVATHGDDIVGLVDAATLGDADGGHAIGDLAVNDYCVISDDTEIMVLQALLDRSRRAIILEGKQPTATLGPDHLQRYLQHRSETQHG
jgi:cystathionine beta-synthase